MKLGPYDIVVVGGGIVGVATALSIIDVFPGRVAVLEAEDHLAAHQTGNNSGVIHSGLYYKPGSLKARLCREGREALYAFCREHGVPHRRTGKLVVATEENQLAALEQLKERGRLNGLAGITRLGREELHDVEPHVEGVAALHVPETGVVDFKAVTRTMARLLQERGGAVHTGTRFIRCRRAGGGLNIETSKGELAAMGLVNCAGLQSDRVAAAGGARPEVRIVPFRGEYYKLAPEAEGLVRHLVYPVPDPRFPFLGVHFTRMVDGSVEAGPNAVLALKREGYAKTAFSLRDTLSFLTFPGFWRMAARYWPVALGEIHRSLSKQAFVRALQALIPGIEGRHLVPGGAGVRAQALDRAGKLLDDFHIVEGDRAVHVLNAPSPAATASIAIGRHIARHAASSLGLASGSSGAWEAPPGGGSSLPQ